MRFFSVVTAIALVLATVTGVTITASPVAADGHDDTVLGGVLDGPDANESVRSWAAGGVSSAWSAATGASDRASWYVGTILPDAVTDSVPALKRDEPDPAAEAKALTTYYNGRNATLEAWANERGNWTTNHTVEITWHLGGETATRYLVVNTSNGNLTSTEMVSSTSRTANQSVDLCGYAAEQSQEELQYFVQNYGEPNEDVETEYLARLKGRYNKDVETTLFPSSGTCGGDA